MTKIQRQMVRKPAMKFPQLQKKMLKQKMHIKQPTGRHNIRNRDLP
jgi:hypothetical protein